MKTLISLRLPQEAPKDLAGAEVPGCPLCRQMAPQRCPHPNSWNREYNKLHDEGDFAGVIKVMGSKIAGVTWIIQVGPIFLQLEAENKVREMHEESAI